jgi:hypothetical protein
MPEGLEDQRHTPLLLEFIGFPGSGKTTIAIEVVRQIRMRNAMRPYFYSKDGKLRFHPREGTAALTLDIGKLSRLLLRGHPREVPRLVSAMKNVLIFRRTRERLSNHPLVVHNQGLIQRLYLMREGDRPSREAIETVLELLRDDLSDVHVVIDTPPAIAAARYFARAKGSSRRPYRNRDEKRIAALYEAHQEVLDWITHWLRRQPHTRVLTLDGRLPAEKNGAILAGKIAEFVP